jgi:hypothetical protein
MATTRVAIAPMKAAQIPKPGADSSAKFPNPVLDTCTSRFRPVASATVICSPKKACGRASSSLACRDTKSPAVSTNWVPVSPSGSRDSA